MRFIVLAFWVAPFINTYAQVTTGVETMSTKTIADKNIGPFLDSVKAKLFSDTLKFNRKDLTHSSLGTLNSKSYSSLFVVNGNYQYKLDIVNGSDVAMFVNEILVKSKVASVYTMPVSASQAIFGIRGMNGAVFIMLDEKVHVERCQQQSLGQYLFKQIYPVAQFMRHIDAESTA